MSDDLQRFRVCGQAIFEAENEANAAEQWDNMLENGGAAAWMIVEPWDENAPSAEELLLEFLTHNKNALHTGKGERNAKLIRRVCEHLGVNEDDYLDGFVVRDKARWGLT